MPQITDINIDQRLTRIAKSYANDMFIADEVFPRLDVENETGIYYVYDPAAQFTIENDLRTGLARANRVENQMSEATYGPLLEHSLEQGITKREMRVMGDAVAREQATNNVTTKVMLNHEKMVADLLRSTSIITQNVTLTSTDRWDTAVSTANDPVADIQTGLDTIDLTGIAGNRTTLIVGYKVWAVLRNSATLKALLANSTTKSALTNDQIANLLGVDELLVGKAKYNTAAEGQTRSLDYVWGKDAILMVRNIGDTNIQTINPGYTLQIAGERYIDRWTETGVKGEFVRFNDYFQPYLVAVEAVYLMKTVIS
jgi:peptidoglycan hydrolase-like protein with peptidoglycan-binding domain